MLSPSSRYARIDVGAWSRDGRSVPYLRRRFAPDPAGIAIMATLATPPNSRIDLIAAKLQGDPLLFWKIADANGAMDPAELLSQPGAPLRIPKLGF